jgi:hypothetical protein
MIPCVPAVPLKIPHAPTLTLEDFLNLFGISQEDMATHHRMIALDVTHWTYFCPNLPVSNSFRRLVLKRDRLMQYVEGSVRHWPEARRLPLPIIGVPCTLPRPENHLSSYFSSLAS